MKRTKKPKRPTRRAVWVARVNLTNSYRRSFVQQWGKDQVARIRAESRAILRAEAAHTGEVVPVGRPGQQWPLVGLIADRLGRL